jgi:hypothetical protein
MSVGTICCDNLTGTEQASNHVESTHRYKGRLKRFLNSTRWRTAGTDLIIRQKEIDVKITAHDRGFLVSMNNRIGRNLYESLTKAKSRIFDVIENGQAEKYLKKHANRSTRMTSQTSERGKDRDNQVR